jgi:protein-tyrosine-phosphatase
MSLFERRALFVCTGNTCRSVIAEHLARRCYPKVLCESAGLRLVASETPENTVEILRSNFGIDASGHKPRELQSVDLSLFDLVVAIDAPGSGRVYEAIKGLGVAAPILVRGKVEDPYGDDPDGYVSCAAAIQRLLRNAEMASRLS